MKQLDYSLLLLALILSGCGAPKTTTTNAVKSEPVDTAIDVVDSVREGLQLDYEITARAADGVPGLVVKFEGDEPDYDSIVKAISENEAVKSFDGELRLWFETQTEPADDTKDPPFLGSFLTTRTYDAKTGQQIP